MSSIDTVIDILRHHEIIAHIVLILTAFSWLGWMVDLLRCGERHCGCKNCK